jgi:hypothetical protein
MAAPANACFPVRVVALALLLGSILLVLAMLAILFGPMAAPARDD